VALTDGTRVGAYEIVGALGAGGMGDVYRARDTRLTRFVALKILPQALMADEDRRTRFAAEARAASGLNHPNIITVYDVGEAGGVSFIAMEFVDGTTLQQLIGRKGLNVRDALKLAVPIADALAAAHAAGIVHRDLKPANVMVTPQGHVKVLDFGVAKLIEPGKAEALVATRTSVNVGPQTEEGTIIGTVAYMSPEQAEGKTVDGRSDIFSFGSLLYEMVTGKRAFQGDSTVATLSAILHREPTPPRELGTNLPPELDRMIAHCLRKDPARRFQHLEDVKTLLEELRDEADSGKLLASAPPPRVPNRTLRRAALVAGVVTLAVAVAAGAVSWYKRTAARPTDVSAIRLTSDSGLTTDPALAADGKLLAFASDRGGRDNLDIWVKQVGASDASRRTTDDADDHEPDFSPDGQRIAFRSDRGGGGIFVVSTFGGENERLIAPEGRTPRFSPDGRSLAYWVGGLGADFAGGSRVYVIPSDGGITKPVATDLVAARYPVWSPDGSRLLVYGARTYSPSPSDSNDWWVVPAGGGSAIKTGAFDVLRRHQLSVSFATIASAWTPAQQVVFSAARGDSTNVWQLPISDSGQISGTPERLTTGTGVEAFPAIASALPSGSLRLAFAAVNQNIDVWSVPFVPDEGANAGRVSGEMQRLTQDLGADVHPALSIDGRLLFYVSNRLGTQDIWTKDLTRGTETVLAGTAQQEWHPAISPDGSTMAYHFIENRKNAIYVTTRGGQPRMLCDEGCFLPWDLSSDGAKLLYWSADQRRIGLLDVASGARTELLKHPKYSLLRASFSPDDRWISFEVIGRSPSVVGFIARVAGQRPLPESEWIPISGSESDGLAGWSPDGNMIYITSYRDGFECFWAQRLDRTTKKPVGAAFPVHHLHSGRRSLGNVLVMFQEFGVSTDKLVFPLSERTGNIWMIDR
jgi:eukaryotic-like serine/threonine-protein kinase